MYTYIVECADGSLYTGIAADIKRRMREHLGNEKSGAKYTRSHHPTQVRAAWKSENRSTASKLEFYIKKLPREKKLQLISTHNLSMLSDAIDPKNYTVASEFIGKIPELTDAF